MDSIDFLKKHGVLVQHASEVKEGDVVARQNVAGNCETSTIRLYCVKQVVMVPSPPYLQPQIPRVYFHAPHVGITIADGRVTRYYIHTPMCGEDYQNSWAKYKETDLECLNLNDSEEIVRVTRKVYNCLNSGGTSWDHLVSSERQRYFDAVVKSGALKDATNEVFFELAKKEMFDLYLVRDINLILLGNLIPKVVVPSWAFMCQTSNMENIFKFVEQVEADLTAAKTLHEKVKSLALSLSR